jgi:hypothetical protein
MQGNVFDRSKHLSGIKKPASHHLAGMGAAEPTKVNRPTDRNYTTTLVTKGTDDE